MRLTSLNRVKNVLGVTNTNNDGALLRLIDTASNRIAYYLRREGSLQLTTRTEYFNPFLGQRVFRLKAYPVSSITSVYTDSTSQFTGGESLVDSVNYMIGADVKTLWFNYASVLNNPLLWPSMGGVYPKSLRITYVGGLSSDATISAWTKSADVGGTMAVGNIVVGQSSQSVGKITAIASGTISIDNIYGIFTAGETLKGYASFKNDLQGNGPQEPTNVTSTLTAVTSLSMAEAYPDMVNACEMFVRYLYKNQDSFNSITISRDGETRSSRSDMKNDSSLTPEVREVLETYKNLFII